MENDKIRVLPDGVANQIAAGEVVGRPASVVKELMENSVDAGSRTITVNYKDGGRSLIQVVDDGCGMSETDARLAFERHATSKIRRAEDLYQLASFGFRGEALPSVASVAEVELRTRTADREIGTQVVIHGGRFVSQEPVQTAVGTQFLVKNLFYNTPARHRFLKEANVEGRHIRSEFLRVALCNPEVAFSLYDNDVLIATLPASNLRQRIVSAIGGKDIAKNLLEVGADTSIVRIEGFVGRPSAAKKTNREQYLFVNGRYFSSPYFRKAILQAYEKLIAPDTQPSYFLYLTIDPQRIDVNVHPQKTEIKFDDEQAVWQIFNAAVRESLGRLGVVPMMDFEMDSSIDIPVFREDAAFRIPDLGINPDFNPFREEKTAAPHVSRASDNRAPKHWENLYPVREDDATEPGFPEQRFKEYDSAELEFIDGSDSGTVQQTLELDAERPFSGVLPFGKRYCVARLREGLAVVDLRRAFERVLFERYRGLLGNNASVTQQLLFPEQVALTREEQALIAESGGEIEAMGFDFRTERDGVSVFGIPADLPDAQIAGTLRELLAELRETGACTDEKRHERMAAILARRGALSLGEAADADAAGRLLGELFACGSFNYTPDGASVLIYITDEEIAGRFNA